MKPVARMMGRRSEKSDNPDNTRAVLPA